MALPLDALVVEYCGLEAIFVSAETPPPLPAPLFSLLSDPENIRRGRSQPVVDGFDELIPGIFLLVLVAGGGSEVFRASVASDGAVLPLGLLRGISCLCLVLVPRPSGRELVRLALSA
jgi:hypothetical protein